MLRDLEKTIELVYKIFLSSDLTKQEALFFKRNCLKLLLSYNERSLFAERLELLGDKVLSLFLLEWLLTEFPYENEGQISKKMSYLNSKEVMGDIVLRNKFYSHSNIKRRADLLESVIGLLYLTKAKGIKESVKRLGKPYLMIYNEGGFNPKGRLQEILAKFNIRPVYSSKKIEEFFEVTCNFNQGGVERNFTAGSKNIRNGESLAAREALYFLSSAKLLTPKSPFIVILSPEWLIPFLNSEHRILTVNKLKIFPIQVELSRNSRKFLLKTQLLPASRNSCL